MKKQILLLFYFGIFLSVKSLAQKTDSLAQQQLLTAYHQTPLWIDMMNDPNVNYYEACKAFDLYWAGREIPAENEEEGEANHLYEKKDKKEEGKSEREREQERTRAKRNGTYKEEEHEEEEGLHFKDPFSYTMIYHYKCFVNWRQTMKNRVNEETGYLLSSAQQEAIWKNQTQGIDTHVK